MAAKGVPAIGENRWVRFLRMYGPLPTNGNMYDEKIQKALKVHGIRGIKLPAQFLEGLVANFQDAEPLSEILTGTAGDGKTYHCREVWTALGGSSEAWMPNEKIHRMRLGGRELVIIKDLSELRGDQSRPTLLQMAKDLASGGKERVYLVAANHGQLRAKLGEAAETDEAKRLLPAIDRLLVSGGGVDADLRLRLRDLSRAPTIGMLEKVVDAVVAHEGWEGCSGCPAMAAGTVCPIRENRSRLVGDKDGGLLRSRLAALVQVSEQNRAHFPIRQLLALIANAILGHPGAAHGLMTCKDALEIASGKTARQASVYGNIFGENLKKHSGQEAEVFRKLHAFGIGVETHNGADNLLVYGGDDPKLRADFTNLVAVDEIYGATAVYRQAQQAYLEGADDEAREEFLHLLRNQRQRLFFVVPDDYPGPFGLWDLTMFRFAGKFMQLVEQVHRDQRVDRPLATMVMRGLNRVFTGMLIENHDELVLASSGSLTQSKASPLLDELIPVQPARGQSVRFEKNGELGIKLVVRVTRDAAVELNLTPTRFEFLGRVAGGALPSSFSLECQEDLLAFKAQLLAATGRARRAEDRDEGAAGEVMLQFIQVGTDGRAVARLVTVRT